jgi:hypothetical protein
MTGAITHTIVGFFPSREAAETAVSDLVREGFARDQISMIASDKRGAATLTDHTPNVGPIESTGSLEDTGEKAAIGALAGTILGIAALAIPGIGPAIAAGPLAMALTGAAAGAATGGLVGVMTKDGVPEESAQRYSKAIGSGSVMVSVHATPERVDHASDVLDRNGAIDIDEPGEHILGTPATTADDDFANRAPLTEVPKFDDSNNFRARQRARVRNVFVHPGITGHGPTPY